MIIDLNAVELHNAYLAEKYTAVKIVEAYLTQIDKLNDEINAYIYIAKDEALKKAKELDKKRDNGEKLGKFAGIIFSIKDNIAVKNMPMTCASKILEDFVPPYNAHIIDLIEKEDGIIIGKTNMDEFAMGFDTKSSYFGVTKNPLDTSRVSGGSSGGGAASIAGKMATVGIATDTGGSIRQPASFCGLIGLKPTYGSVSRYGIAPMANTFDQPGAITKTVEDSIYVLSYLVEKDLKDKTNLGNKMISEEKIKSAKPLDKLKIAIPKEFLDFKIESDVKEGMQKSISILKEKGALIEEIDFKLLKHCIEIYHILVNSEISSNMSRYDGIIFGKHKGNLEDYDSIEDLYTKTRSNGFGEEVKRRIILGTYIMSSGNEEAYHGKAEKLRTLMIEEFNEIFEEFDLIICPTFPKVSYPIDETLSVNESYISDMFTIPANIIGGCAISIPMKTNGNLPMGVQFIGQRFTDHQLLRTALDFERSINNEL